MRPKHVGDDGGAGGDDDLGGNKLTLIMMTAAKSGATPASRGGAPLPGKAASEERYIFENTRAHARHRLATSPCLSFFKLSQALPD